MHMSKTIKSLLFAGLLAFALPLSACSGTQKSSQSDTTEEKTVKYTVKENDTYWAPDDPTEYIAKTYDDVSASLGKSDEEQAKAVITAFLADFFTLSNKDSDGDIGGLDYIPAASNEDFAEYAKYYYYNNYAQIKAKDGRSALPQVVNVTLSNVTPAKITYMDNEYDGYTMNAAIEYADSPEASNFKTSAKCSIIKVQDVHYVSKADVTGTKEAGEPKDVYRVIAVE